MTASVGGGSVSLAGRTAWITGAGRGLGRRIALGFARSGAVVALTARSQSEVALVRREIDALGGRALALPGDVADSTFVAGAVHAIVAEYGAVDVLVNCAGISPFVRPSEAVTDDEWAQVLSVNLTGAYYCARSVGASLLHRGAGGSIVNITSVHAHTGYRMIAPYAASKGGLEALTRTLAVEWADRGIRVNTLAPGYFRTDLSGPLLDSSHGPAVLARIPLGRYGQGDELADAALFLASDAAGYVTGTTLFVDGGWTAQ